VEDEDEFIEEDFFVDSVSPPICDIYSNEEDLLEVCTTMCLMKVYTMKDLS
jgi:hypothetical protein